MGCAPPRYRPIDPYGTRATPPARGTRWIASERTQGRRPTAVPALVVGPAGCRDAGSHPHTEGTRRVAQGAAHDRDRAAVADRGPLRAGPRPILEPGRRAPRRVRAARSPDHRPRRRRHSVRLARRLDLVPARLRLQRWRLLEPGRQPDRPAWRGAGHRHLVGRRVARPRRRAHERRHRLQPRRHPHRRRIAPAVGRPVRLHLPRRVGPRQRRAGARARLAGPRVHLQRGVEPRRPTRAHHRVVGPHRRVRPRGSPGPRRWPSIPTATRWP